MNEKKEFIPEITINNKSEKKIVMIEGVNQEVEIPAKKGFNITSRTLEGEYVKEYLSEELEAVILFDRYQIQSKYNSGDNYSSNEFDFGDENSLSVYSRDQKKVIFQGTYNEAKEHFATGQKTKYGTPEKTFDVFAVLYILTDGQVFRFKWKLNPNNNWFEYKKDLESQGGSRAYRGYTTKFLLDKKKVGSNEFWVCNLSVGSEVDPAQADEIVEELNQKNNTQDKVKEDDGFFEPGIEVEKTPF